MPRVVSVIANGTEIARALGGGDQVLGRSHEGNHPPAVRALPVGTEPAFDTSGPSAEIDRWVNATLRDAVVVYRVHVDLRQRLQPDPIVTQTPCEIRVVNRRGAEALG